MNVEASVVVASRDRADSLRRLVAALAAQQTARAFEVIVVDDGSEPAYDEPLLDGLADARLLSGAGRGPAAARNAGLEASRADVVVFADDDTQPHPGWLDAACEFLAAHPGHVGVEGRVESPDWDPLREMSMRVEAPGSYLTANIAYRRALLVDEGGFDADAFPMHGEDVDLAFRMLRRGPIGFEPRMASIHEPRTVSMGQMIGRARMHANDVELFRRHRERFGRASRLPAPLFPLVSVVSGWAGVARVEGARMLRPDRAARWLVLTTGQLVRAAAAVVAGALRRR